MKGFRDEDKRIFESYMNRIGRYGSTLPPGELMVRTGLFFLGCPYASDTLTSPGDEPLTINLRSFDCVTFVETTLALVMTAVSERKGFDTFAVNLRRVRYRGGRKRGYASRLHYFSEWLYDNARMGILADVGQHLGGIETNKEINYMTSHRDLYPSLADPAIYRRMADVERRISHLRLFMIPRKDLAERADAIEGGDIIGVATSRVGLDCLHAGLAVVRGKERHLLHAGSEAGRVAISTVSLFRYVTATPQRTGLFVMRWRGSSLQKANSSIA